MADSYSSCKNVVITIGAGTGFTSYSWNTGATSESIAVTQSGSYEVTVTSQNGCTTTKSTEVYFLELPQLQLPKDTTISTDDILNIDAGSGYQSYLWNTGSENQILTLTSLTPGCHTYSVKVSDQNNCFAEDAILVTVITASDIQEREDNSGIIIFPNPGSNVLFLKTSNSINNKVIINIVDNAGKVVLQNKFNNLLNTLIYQIDVSDLSEGVYFIQIKTKQDIKVDKIVLELNLWSLFQMNRAWLPGVFQLMMVDSVFYNFVNVSSLKQSEKG